MKKKYINSNFYTLFAIVFFSQSIKAVIEVNYETKITKDSLNKLSTDVF